MTTRIGLPLFTLLGLILGATLDYCVHQHITAPFFPVLITLLCLLYALSFNEENSLRLMYTSAIVALLLSLPLFPLDFEKLPSHSEHLFFFMCAFPTYIYVAHCFHYAYHRDNTLDANYTSLFEAVWSTVALFVVATIFSSLLNLLILLGATVFKSVGFSFVWDYYYGNHHVYFISNVVFFFMGLAIGQQQINILTNLRFLLLKMMHYLLPILAFISVMYVILYSVSYLTGGETPVEPLVILMPLGGLGIIFFNAYFQDGMSGTVFPKHLKSFLRVYRVVLFILVLIMVYRIFQLISIETNTLIMLLSVIFFAGTYGISTCLKEAQEVECIQKGNIATGWFIVGALFICNLPYLPIDFKINNKKSFTNFGSAFNQGKKSITQQGQITTNSQG